jgi:hypothetical protein
MIFSNFPSLRKLQIARESAVNITQLRNAWSNIPPSQVANLRELVASDEFLPPAGI